MSESLKALSLATSYHKGENDIAAEFYLPCMRNAVSYDRAVGFFSSSVYVLAWPELAGFVERRGRIRIVCSPILSPDDVEAIRLGCGAEVEARIDQQIAKEIRSLAADEVLGKPTRVLATLVQIGVVEIRLAFMTNTTPAHARIFHDKLGIFADRDANAVAFRGSMNETWSGLSFDGNLESVDVYLGWDEGRDAERVRTETAYFERLWENDYPGVQVRRFPDISAEELSAYSDRSAWPEWVKEIQEGIEATPRTPGGRVPRKHQLDALAAWEERGRRGILKHATGSGKTFTALLAIRDSLRRGESVLVLVPSRLLLRQWYREIAETLGDLHPKVLRCGDGHDEWRTKHLLSSWTSPEARDSVVLSTLGSAATEQFLGSVRQGDHLMVVADEVHRLGSLGNRAIFGLQTGARLGLSATPERFRDEDGTTAIFTYFDGLIPVSFTLRDGINCGALVPYFYYPRPVALAEDEQESWDAATAQIRQLVARREQEGADRVSLDRQLQELWIRRARIIKRARGKVALAVETLSEEYEDGQKWLVYCEDSTQLTEVLDAIRAAGIRAHEYHTQMPGDRDQTMVYFSEFGGVLVAIKCLDEGVDIPDVTHALILASSKNPREFIQRRGRVLRKAPGKYLAFVYDPVVTPCIGDEGEPDPGIVVGELGRAIEFARDAENPSAVPELERIAGRYGVDWADFVEEGFEDES
ncbi:MAG: DEAD/DEAH box helicase family protein [Armatimonadetes bacterium]|nr:DEAD/DEAH box helicase family protein [Armatimonadota bacterium]